MTQFFKKSKKNKNWETNIMDLVFFRVHPLDPFCDAVLQSRFKTKKKYQ